MKIKKNKKKQKKTDSMPFGFICFSKQIANTVNEENYHEHKHHMIS